LLVCQVGNDVDRSCHLSPMLREYESERAPKGSADRAQTGSKRNGENDLLSLASPVQSGNGAASPRPRPQPPAIQMVRERLWDRRTRKTSHSSREHSASRTLAPTQRRTRPRG